MFHTILRWTGALLLLILELPLLIVLAVWYEWKHLAEPDTGGMYSSKRWQKQGNKR